jgi:hypothetical protein
MATVTPNFNWPVPTSTDLVKDGATAIEALGDSIDASLVDLKGGTSGQVLAKASGTDMDFAWVAQDDSNAIQNSIVNAKGDLIGASANDTPAILSVGANGETLVADSSTSTGLRYQGNFAAGKNKVINGDFGIWQRGTSFSSASYPTYYADRFYGGTDGSGITRTVSQQTFTPGAAPVAGYEGKYFLRVNQSVAGTGSGYNVLDTRIEDVQTLAGQTATYSFWAKADASRTISATFTQFFGTGGSSNVDVSLGTFSLTTSWQRFTVTFSVPSISGKTIGTGSSIGTRFGLPLNTVMSIDFWGLQLEAGSVATAFQTATGTIQGELAACQRYYYQITDGATFQPVATALYLTNSQIVIPFDFKQTMRAKPTLIASSGSTYYYAEINTNADYFNSLTLLGATASAGTVSNSTEASGSASTSAIFGISNAAASVAFSAEL